MKILLDTHVVLWLAQEPERLSQKDLDFLASRKTEIFFSVVSLWETGVKRNLGRPEFQMDPYALREELITHDFTELPVLGEHTLKVNHLPDLHSDPFDRLLICQALSEELTLMTRDSKILQYPNLSTMRC